MTEDDARALEQHLADVIRALWAGVPLTPPPLVRCDQPVTVAEGRLILWPPLCRN